MSPRRSDNLESYGEDYGRPQRAVGDLEPRVAVTEKRLSEVELRVENVAVNHERTLSWVTDLAKELKELHAAINSLCQSVTQLRVDFAWRVGLIMGGAMAVSALINKIL